MKYKFALNDVWDVDERGMTTVPNKPYKILAARGKINKVAFYLPKRKVCTHIQ